MKAKMNVAIKTLPVNGNGHRTHAISDAPAYSNLDAFLISIGAKQMANEKPTSPLEWNGKVVGLTVGLLAVVSMLVATVFWAATLAAKVDSLKTDIDRVISEREKLTITREAQLKQMDERIRILEVQAAAQRQR